MAVVQRQLRHAKSETTPWLNSLINSLVASDTDENGAGFTVR
jgi:hypothetical protein